VQPIHLIDSPPRHDPRVVLSAVVLGLITLAAAYVLGSLLNLEKQVMALVILDILLLTTFVAFYDITNSIILWIFALTCITRYTQLNLPGIPDMSGPRFMLVLMWVVFMVEVALRRRRPLPIGAIELTMLVFIGVNLVSMIQHENLVHTAARISPITAFMNFVVLPFSVYYMARNASASDRATGKLLKAFAALQIYLALTGIFEHYRLKWLVFPPDILDPKAGDGRWYGVRVRGPYLHSPIYGAVMGMGFFVLVHLFNYTRNNWRWALMVGILATPLACFYTLTRQVWIGLVLPMLFGAVFSSRHRMMLVLIALAACAVLVTVDLSLLIDPEVAKDRASNEATGHARIAHYVVGFQMFLDKPIFGHGLEMWGESWEIYRSRLGNFHSWFGTIDMNLARHVDAHNTFLRLAVELGLAGLIPYVVFLVLITMASLHLYRQSGKEGLYGRELVLTFWQMGIAFMVCVNFVDPSMNEFLGGYFLVMAAVIVRRAELIKDPVAARAAGVTFGVTKT
jgi:O-Antigen ligase